MVEFYQFLGIYGFISFIINLSLYIYVLKTTWLEGQWIWDLFFIQEERFRGIILFIVICLQSAVMVFPLFLLVFFWEKAMYQQEKQEEYEKEQLEELFHEW